VTSQGQRFRRRSLRRGYKIEEVDSFLDRVEAMLNGERVEPPVRSKDVHDIVFRVKFGGYDEWQVDLHLDRVERQLAEREPEAGRMIAPERAHQGQERPGMYGRDERSERPFERPAVPGGPMPGAGVPVAGMPAAGMSRPGQPATNYSRYDDPTERGDAPEPPFGPPPGYRQNTGYGPPPPSGGRTYGSPAPAAAPAYGERPDQPRPDRPGQGPGYGPNERGMQSDRTGEMRMPPGGGPTGGMAPPPRPAAPGGFPGGAPGTAPADVTQQGPVAAPMSPDMQRVDQLRRTFQPRRFGSGYDRVAVDSLFEGILATLSGRAGRPVGDADLDPRRFNLVPGGYYEDEVDDALRQARDILRRR